VWRIGLMGFNSRPSCVMEFLAALERCLVAQGVKVSPGAGVAAAIQFYARNGS
jgi:alanine-glyoxylate transaminase/serine-glyoxylate transaminase/serine-pyruvate transaminase